MLKRIWKNKDELKKLFSTEEEYRQHYLGIDIVQAMICITCWQIPVFLFAYSDYVQCGINEKFFMLISIRLLFLLISLCTIFMLKKIKQVEAYDWLIFGWSFITTCFIFFVNLARPIEYINYVIIDILVLICYYFIFLNKLSLRVFAALLFTAGNITIFHFVKSQADSLTVNAVWISYFTTNIVCIILAWRIDYSRRIQYEAIMKQERTKEELNRLATIDELTGIFNRRMVFAMGEKELIRFKRYQRLLAVMILDLDNFKKVNDTYGHQVGDRVLIDFVGYIKQYIRETDIFGRIGGDEFVLILPETDKKALEKVGERITLNNIKIEVPDSDNILELSVSIGGTLAQESDSTFDDLIKRADYGLYEAKYQGRKQMILR